MPTINVPALLDAAADNGDIPNVLAVAALAREGVEPKVVELLDANGAKRQVLVAQDGARIESVKKLLAEYRDKPERRAGTARLADLPSFIAHANRFRDADSALFAQPSTSAPKLVCVFDYHRAGATADPRFGEHRAEYAFPVSDEWSAWTSKNAKGMSQADFAEWVENRITDVIAPDDPGPAATAFAAAVGCEFASPSRLLELSRGLSVRVGTQVRNAQNLSSGEAQLTYVSEHQDERGRPLTVPGAFLIAIPVFRGDAAYKIAARLRYRVREGAITWFFELYRTDLVFDDAFRAACEQAEEKTTLPLYLGTPEA